MFLRRIYGGKISVVFGLAFMSSSLFSKFMYLIVSVNETTTQHTMEGMTRKYAIRRKDTLKKIKHGYRNTM